MISDLVRALTPVCSTVSFIFAPKANCQQLLVGIENKIQRLMSKIFSYQIAHHTHTSLLAQRLDQYIGITSEQGQLRLKIIYSIINCNILQLRLFSHIPSCTSDNTITRVFAEVEPPAVTKFSEISSEYPFLGTPRFAAPTASIYVVIS